MYQPDDVSGMDISVVVLVNMFLSFFYMIIRSESGKRCGSLYLRISVYVCVISSGQIRVERTGF